MAHLVLDIQGVRDDVDIGHAPTMLCLLRRIANESAATIVNECYHQFQPTGATAILLLAESHMSIHTYPETRCVHIDFYHCGQDARARVERAAQKFTHCFGGRASSCFFDRS